jgi:predicted PurR-regulated permease PerM
MSERAFVSRVLTVLIVILGYLSFQVIRPFLTAIMWAIILTVVFYPMHQFIARYMKSNTLSSLISLFIIILIIVGPVSYILYLLVSEISSLVSYVGSKSRGLSVDPLIMSLVKKVLSHFGVSSAELTRSLAQNISLLAKKAASQVPRQAGSVLTVSFDSLLMMVALFFLLKDGPGVLKRGLDYIRVSKKRKERLKTQVQDIIVSSIYGGVFSAFAHGIVGGVAFAITGIPSPVLLGLAAAISSLIPLAGSAIVWGPVIIYLFIIGKVLKAVILIAIAAAMIPAIDNLLRPFLVGTRGQIPFVIIFFGILGGLEFFGLIGLVMGPLVLAVFISLLTLYYEISSENGADH